MWLMDPKLFVGSIVSYLYNYHLGALPSRTLRMGLLRIILAECGDRTYVQMNSRFLNPRKVYLGNRNVINFGCLFDGRRHTIRTGNNVSIGPEAVILTLGHEPQSPEFADKGADVVIGDRVWIGFRAIILPGVTLGEGSVVAAGAVVTRNVEPYTIVAGSPAKSIGTRTTSLLYHLDFNPWLL
jgi:acetyltransferase-like isoleucine patch superfamily enzyme